jgi:signal transduction histidine kinase
MPAKTRRPPTAARRPRPRPKPNALALRLLSAQEEERRRIARLLHDDLGQTLTAAVLELEYARTAPDAAEVIDAVVAELRRLLGAARDLSLALRPALLDEEGLEAAFGALASRLAGVRGAKVDLECALGGVEVPLAIALSAFRIAQDALLPLAARDATLRLRVRATRTGLRLAIDGPAPAPGQDIVPATVADRVAVVGGSLRPTRRAGRVGIVALLPLPAPPRRSRA